MGSGNFQSTLEKLAKLFEKKQGEYFVDGVLNKNRLAEEARRYDAGLLNLLQGDADIKSHFFAKTDGGLIFKKDVFLQFISNKEFLPDSYTKYKIKIGLGGEDGSLLSENGDVVLNWPYKDAILEGGQDKEDQKRSEVFFNEVLAPDQITRLLDDKVFTNWKRYDKDGEHELDELKDDDNLIIKGNNLVVLHSLKKKFAGKVKLIYIDPPYNTGNDGFNYNDNFNHSTWLTFMKNRLEIAKELLSYDGSIFIQLDHNEVHYCKVLVDEIFGEDNFRNEIIWAYQGAGQSKRNFKRKHDNILFYSKSGDNYFDWEAVGEKIGERQKAKYTSKDEKGYYKSYKHANGEVFKKYFDENEIMPRLDYWTDISIIQSKHERTDISGQKPEKLLERIILSASKRGDIILDYHLGSGTTAAVAHKMGRRYIGIEQLYYGENDATVRLQNVINGDTSGISKSVDWQGGGSFVYANIMNNANKFRERVERAKNDEEYMELLREATGSSFLSYRIDPKKLNEDDFRKLSGAEKQRLLLELIDNNTLYVNYEDINDPSFKVSDKDKEFNKKLYE